MDNGADEEGWRASAAWKDPGDKIIVIIIILIMIMIIMKTITLKHRSQIELQLFCECKVKHSRLTGRGLSVFYGVSSTDA